MTDIGTGMFRQNQWANLRLIDACRSLTEEQLDATAEGTFGPIRDTLAHIVRAEGAYAAQLGREPSQRLVSGDPWPGLDGLAEMATAAADALVAAAGDGTDRILRVGTEEHWDVAAEVVLLQAFHHGTDHRSQVCTMLTVLGIEPPELSGWEWGYDTGTMRRV